MKDKSASDDLAAANAVPGARLEVAYTTAVDSGLAKLPPAAKTAANKRFAEALQGDLRAGEVAATLAAYSQYVNDSITYRGSKAHMAKLVDAAIRNVSRPGDEREFERLARATVLRAEPRLTLKLMPKMRAQFPMNPLLALAEAQATLATKPRSVGPKLLKLLTIASQSTDPRHEESAAVATELINELFAFRIGDFFGA